MQLGARIYLAGLVVFAGCGTSDKGSGVPALPDAQADTTTTPPVDADPGGCSSNAECTERATKAAIDAGRTPDGAGGVVPAVCVRPGRQCVELLSEDCEKLTGNFRSDDAIVLATLLSTEGVQSATNVQRQQAAALAVEQVNAVGGIPAAVSGGNARPLVLVFCDESTNLLRAAKHVVNELHVPAILGPNTSQDTIDLSNELTIQAGTLLLTPTAVASSITELVDNDLTWLMVPSDMQRAKLMIHQINALERERAVGGKTTVRLAIVHRNDALGLGTRRSLSELVINGKPLSDPINTGSPTGNAIVADYDVKATDQNALVVRLAAFAPDIVVLAGTAESVTTIMKPLEQQWPEAGATRPHYVLIDSAKVPDLIEAASNASLRARIRGTGVRPSPQSLPLATAFELDFRAKYGMIPTASGVGPTYDAAYALTYALAATRGMPITGATIATGLRRLSGGNAVVNVGSSELATAFARLSMGENITGIGTFVPFEWDARGAVKGGVIEVWCLGAPAGTASYQSSGLTYDVKTDTISGAYTPCGP